MNRQVRHDLGMNRVAIILAFKQATTTLQSDQINVPQQPLLTAKSVFFATRTSEAAIASWSQC